MAEKTTFEEEINKNGYILQQTVGDSMEPLLHNKRSIVKIEKVYGKLKEYDVPLYHRPNGAYVLHRIVKVRKNDYLICGDNRENIERVPHEWVIGVMTMIIDSETGKVTSVGDKSYLEYVEKHMEGFWSKRYKEFAMKAPGRFIRKMNSVKKDLLCKIPKK